MFDTFLTRNQIELSRFWPKAQFQAHWSLFFVLVCFRSVRGRPVYLFSLPLLLFIIYFSLGIATFQCEK